MKRLGAGIAVVSLGLALSGCELRTPAWLEKLLPPPSVTERIGAGPEPVRWTMIDVTEGDKQADAHLIEFADGTRYLIDSGFTGTKIIPFLRRHGIRRIDGVLITHMHKDHYGGLLPLIEAGVEVGEVRLNVPDRPLCEAETTDRCDVRNIQETVDTLRNRKIPVRPAHRGDVLHRTADGKASLDVLYAFNGPDNPAGTNGGVNDTSVIAALSRGATRALFTGDLNRPLGEYLAVHGSDLQAQVLKVPHHGTEACAPDLFFDRVGARLALVPAPGVLWKSDRSSRIRNYFESRHVPVRVSGIDGDVEVALGPDPGPASPSPFPLK